MKLVNALVLIGLFVLYGLLLFQSYHKYAEDHADHHGHSYSYSYSATKKLSDSDIDKLVNLVLIQNQTIAMLEQHILLSKEGLDQAFQDKVLAIGKLMDQLVDAAPEGGGAIDSGNSVEDDNRKSVSSIHKCPVCITSAVNSVERNSIYGSNSYSNSSITLPSTSMEKDCEKRYGLELVQQWKKNKEVWCASGSNSVVESELVCYPYHQHHKKLDGRTADVICEAKNFVIDFSKIRGDYFKTAKPQRGHEYLMFNPGSLMSNCATTVQYKPRLFQPHHSLQMRTFESDNVADTSSYTIEETPTYLLARDEDCENSFHSTADFMNMLLVSMVLDLPVTQQQVMLFDRFPDGPYHELIQKAYSPNHPLVRPEKYKHKKIMFRHLVFHLESPAGLIFPKVARPDPLRCYQTSFFDAYRRHVLQAFGLLDVPPPPIPVVTLSLRHRTAHKNVGRVMANEEAVIKVLKKGNMMELNVVDTAKMSYFEQLKLIRNTNVLVGVHGAGLMFIMFAADEAVLVEIHPSYRQDRHFRHASRMTGKIYMPMRSNIRETCVGSSDSVTVPIDEFERTMDGALRVARSFDDGLSECGLVCPPNVLALDTRLNHYYKSGETRSVPINTKFPCY